MNILGLWSVRQLLSTNRYTKYSNFFSKVQGCSTIKSSLDKAFNAHILSQLACVILSLVLCCDDVMWLVQRSVVDCCAAERHIAWKIPCIETWFPDLDIRRWGNAFCGHVADKNGETDGRTDKETDNDRSLYVRACLSYATRTDTMYSLMNLHDTILWYTQHALHRTTIPRIIAKRGVDGYRSREDNFPDVCCIVVYTTGVSTSRSGWIDSVLAN